MITFLLASAFAVNFPGGTPNAFAEALAGGTQQNVVLSQGESQAVPKVAFENADLTEMARAIRSQTDHAILPGSDLVLSDQMLAKSLVTGGGFLRDPSQKRVPGEPVVNFESIQLARRSKIARAPANFIALPAEAIANGLVTYKTEKADALQLQTLDGPFSKPVKFHWIYAETPIFVQVKGLPELDFMKWVAKATGARLVSSGKDYDFTLDPVVVRNRAVATLNRLSIDSGDQDEQKTYKFRIACLGSLTPGEVSEALTTPYAQVRVQLRPGSPLANLAVGRIRDLEKLQKTYADGTRASKAAVGLLDRVDSNRSAFLIMDAKFYTRLEVPVLDQNGRPAGVVNL